MFVIFYMVFLSVLGSILHFTALKEKHGYRFFELLYLYFSAFCFGIRGIINLITDILEVNKELVISGWNAAGRDGLWKFAASVLFVVFTVGILAAKEKSRSICLYVCVSCSIAAGLAEMYFGINAGITFYDRAKIIIVYFVIPLFAVLLYRCYRWKKRKYVRYLFEKKTLL